MQINNYCTHSPQDCSAVAGSQSHRVANHFQEAKKGSSLLELYGMNRMNE
jgi:hypothetical protein